MHLLLRGVLPFDGHTKDEVVDLWSLGCIMHLLLRGVLPFDGHTKDEVVEKTLNKKLNLTHKKWDRVSGDAKDLISKLLIKDPAHRISLEDALKHQWFDRIKEKKQIHDKINANISAMMSKDKDHGEELLSDSNTSDQHVKEDFELVDKLQTAARHSQKKEEQDE